MLALLNMYQRLQKQAPDGHNVVDKTRECDNTANSVVQVKDVLANLEVDSENTAQSEHVAATRQRLRALAKFENCINECVATLKAGRSNASSSQVTEPQGGINMDRLYSDIGTLALKRGTKDGKLWLQMSKSIPLDGQDKCLRVRLAGHSAGPVSNEAPAEVVTPVVKSRCVYSITPDKWVLQHDMREMEVPSVRGTFLKIEMIVRLGQKIEGNQIRLVNGTVRKMPERLSAL